MAKPIIRQQRYILIISGAFILGLITSTLSGLVLIEESPRGYSDYGFPLVWKRVWGGVIGPTLTETNTTAFLANALLFFVIWAAILYFLFRGRLK